VSELLVVSKESRRSITPTSRTSCQFSIISLSGETLSELVTASLNGLNARNSSYSRNLLAGENSYFYVTLPVLSSV
jgi:hypothetical protein